VQREPLSVRQRMSDVLSRVQEGKFVDFVSLFTPGEGRMGVVVTFLAILELIRESVLDLVQSEPFAPIHIKARGAADAGDASTAQPATGA
jgi:segregation and condensation protein A